MLVIGLTGGIATGKSTVSRLLAAPPHSLPIVDADIIAREVVLPGTAGYNAILAHFQSTTPGLLYDPPESDPIPHPSGLPNINRAVLGRRIFASVEDRNVLNGIVHPAVRKEMAKQMFKYFVQGYWAVVLDVPLLFEGGLDVLTGKTLVVGLSEEEMQMQRLMARDAHLSESEARDRVRSQMGMQEKAKKADEVIWNDGSKEELEKQVREFVQNAKTGRGPLWTWFLVLCWPVAAVLAGVKMLQRSQEKKIKAKL